MGTDSILELYTMLWGWHQYGAIWDILKESGLAFIPFFGMLLKHTLEPLKSQDPGSAGTASLAGLEIQFFTALVVIIVAAQPTLPLDLERQEYIPICIGKNHPLNQKRIAINQSKQGKGGIKTSFDVISVEAFNDVKVPIWWFGVLSVSHGIVRAMQSAIPCVDDLRTKQNAINAGIIRDPDLIEDIKEFHQFCYVKAFSQFDRHTQQGINNLSQRKAIIENVTAGFGRDDPYWVRSEILHRLYYGLPDFKHSFRTINAGDRVSCEFANETFQVRVLSIIDAFLKQVDASYDRAKMIEQIEHDLRPTLVPGTIPPVFIENARVSALKKLGFSNTARVIYDYEIFKTVLAQSIPNKQAFNFADKGFTGVATRVVAEVGTFIAQVGHYSEVDMVRRTFPMLISVMLMATFIFLPFGLVFSSYNVSFLVMAAIGIIGLKMTYYLFHVIWWMDQNLINLVGMSTGIGDIFSSSIRTISLVTTSLYLVVPLLWAAIVTWAMNQAGGGVAQAFEAGTRAAREGARLAASTLTDMNLRMSFNWRKLKKTEGKDPTDPNYYVKKWHQRIPIAMSFDNSVYRIANRTYLGATNQYWNRNATQDQYHFYYDDQGIRRRSSGPTQQGTGNQLKRPFGLNLGYGSKTMQRDASWLFGQQPQQIKGAQNQQNYYQNLLAQQQKAKQDIDDFQQEYEELKKKARGYLAGKVNLQKEDFSVWDKWRDETDEEKRQLDRQMKKRKGKGKRRR